MENYLNKLHAIKCFVFDVDGVLTDGDVGPDYRIADIATFADEHRLHDDGVFKMQIGYILAAELFQQSGIAFE